MILNSIESIDNSKFNINVQRTQMNAQSDKAPIKETLVDSDDIITLI